MDPVNPRWQHFDHGADVGVRGIGPTQAQAFEQTALALSAAVTSLETINPGKSVRIRCQNDDPEMLLVDWLNAVIFAMATSTMVFGRYEIDIANGKLTAKAWGETVDVQKHQPAVELKGATYTELKVKQRAGGWVAQTVVDV